MTRSELPTPGTLAPPRSICLRRAFTPAPHSSVVSRKSGGNATALSPDLIVGYARGYRASWATCLGDLTDEVLLDNDSAWSADHCADALEVPGVLCCNRRIQAQSPALVDVAPSILAEFGLPTPASMTGRSFIST